MGLCSNKLREPKSDYGSAKIGQYIKNIKELKENHLKNKYEAKEQLDPKTYVYFVK